jgi:hypothetical protein
MTTTEDDVDLLPILGTIARAWNRIHPFDLTAPEAISLMGVLTEITDRIDAERMPDADPVNAKPALRLVRELTHHHNERNDQCLIAKMRS